MNKSGAIGVPVFVLLAVVAINRVCAEGITSASENSGFEATQQFQPPQSGASIDCDALINQVASALCEGNDNRAFNFLKAALNGQPPEDALLKLNELNSFVEDMSKVDKLVESYLLSKVGSDIVMRSGKKYKAYTIKCVLNNTFYADVDDIVDGESKTIRVSFNASQLDPADKARMIKDSDKTSTNIMKCVLLVRGGLYNSASEYAPKCGPLAEPLKSYIHTRLTAKHPN